MPEHDVCEVRFVNEEKVQPIRDLIDQEDTIFRLAETFKALADPTRLKILYALSHAELCVCDISCVLGASESAVSHQLRLLRAQRIVKFRRAGKMAYYSLDDKHIEQLFEMGLHHVQEDKSDE
jgi:DNA-binding transcriptional ArsR family regulator